MNSIAVQTSSDFTLVVNTSLHCLDVTSVHSNTTDNFNAATIDSSSINLDDFISTTITT